MEYTKENIKTAFWELYEGKQIGKITVSEVCRKAGYNRSTFYEYYKDIYEVLEDIETELITKEDFRDLILKNIVFGDVREQILNQFLALYEAKGRYLSVLLGEHGDPSFRPRLINRVAPVIIEMAGGLSESDHRRLMYLMEYQSSGIMSILNRWFLEGKPVPAEDMVEILMSVSIHGIQQEMMALIEKKGRHILA